MGRVSRLSGAILAETEGNYYLIGDLKEPCDFEKAGFENPGEIAPLKEPFKRLTSKRPIELKLPVLEIDLEGEALAKLLSRSLTIARNGSVSERLWSLILDAEENEDEETIQANWLATIPAEIWDVVRESILKCK